MTMLGTVISLCDKTGNMVRPWAEAGYECWCYDIDRADFRSATPMGFARAVFEANVPHRALMAAE